MKKLILIMGLLLIGIASAEYGTIETWKTGSNDIVVHVYDRQSGTDLTGVTCTIDILSSVFAVLVNDAAMEDSGNGWYNYTYTQSTAGTYNSRIKCIFGSNGSSTTTSFKLVANTLNDSLDSIDTAINSNSSLLATAIDGNQTETNTSIGDIRDSLNNSIGDVISRGDTAWTTVDTANLLSGQETISGDLNATELAILQNTTLLEGAIIGNQSETNSSIGDIRDTLNTSIGDVLVDTGNILDNQTTIYNKINDTNTSLIESGALGILHGDYYWNTSTLSAADFWTYATRTLSAFGFNVGLSSSAIDLIWNEAQAGHTTPGTFGYFLNYTLSEVPSKGLNTSQDETLTGIRSDIGIFGAYDQCLACMLNYNVSDGNVEADMDGVFTNQTLIIRRCRHVSLSGY